ncbi:MAG: class I SAM-dependent methyltransferase [Erythrobacter sp.]
MRRAGFALAILAAAVLAGCDSGLLPAAARSDSALEFPKPYRPVDRPVSTEFGNEDSRDELREAQIVMDLAQIRGGMTVADIGAGEGYYTVRLADRVGADGRVLAQDINRDALERLGRRVERERLENISIKLGEEDNPQLPVDSFDRIFMVHMYHEVAEPYAFLWRMWPALTAGGEIVVVETDRPAGRHGLPHTLLFCEFEAIGYQLIEFTELPDNQGYFARFGRGKSRVAASAIKPCKLASS